jgi:predicted nuclease of predicted toxin-antitoxin system
LQNSGKTGNDLDDTILQRAFGRGGKPVTVRDIFNLLAAEKGSTKKILRARPDIRHETISLGRAFLIANHPELYEEIVKKKPLKDYRILIDENISARVAPNIRDGFGYITHTNFVGLAGKKDPEVWAWAVNNRIDAIITRDQVRKTDQDLTEIAVRSTLAMMAREGQDKVDFASLPLIIHVDCMKDVTHTVGRLFNRYRNGIQRHMEARITPYIKVGETGIQSGPPYTDLLPEPPKGEQRDFDNRYREWVQRWMKAILDQHKGPLTPELEKQVRRIVEDSGRQSLIKRAQGAVSNDNGDPRKEQRPPKPPAPFIP